MRQLVFVQYKPQLRLPMKIPTYGVKTVSSIRAWSGERRIVQRL